MNNFTSNKKNELSVTIETVTMAHFNCSTTTVAPLTCFEKQMPS